MRWKKPEWLQKAQTAANNIIKPITTSPVVKNIQRAATNVVKPITTSARKFKVKMPRKPKVVQQVQKAAQKTADNVGSTVNKAADKVGDVVRPAAQSVAKEVGHMVNPAIGEVALRGKQLAQASAPVLKRIGDKLGDAGREVSSSIREAGQQAAGGGGRLMPYFTKILPDTLSDTAKGILRTGKGIVTFDGDEVMSGIKRTARGIGDTLYHTGKGGIVEPIVRGFTKQPGDTIDGSGAGGYGPQQKEETTEKTESPQVETPEQKAEREKDEKTLSDYGAEAWDAFKDFTKMVYEEGIKPGFDSMDVKTKRAKYKGTASDAELEVYRRAEAAGDKRTQEMMEAQWQYRQKYGRDYMDDLMEGKVYQM